MDWWIYCFWFFVVLACSFVVSDHYRKKRRRKIEFKCLEHMTELSRWDGFTRTWCCPEPGCDALVDAETRWLYEGVKPPNGS